MKTILGLDLGTNSIGWSLIHQDEKERLGKIVATGSRILPMSQDILGKFDSGQSLSQTAERTDFRGIRRLRERQLLRRERLHRVLNILGFLPDHYAKQIDFSKKLGQFIPETEPKLPYIFNPETNKSDFIFKKSFDEMLLDFEKYQPQLLKDNKKVPYDWTIYYLRKKALEKKIEKEELAWLLLNFNQKRGYYQLRGEDEEENPNKLIEFFTLEVSDVIGDEPQRGKDEIWYSIVLENGWVYRRASKVPLFDWKGKTKEFIVTTDINDDKTIKTDKEGKEKRSFKAVDSEKDWIAIKKSTEEKIHSSQKTVGTYIYDTLLQNPNQKIKGKLVRVIERKFYKAELELILKTQQEFHCELKDKNLYQSCLQELYENNDAHRNSNSKKDFVHLFLNDIIFYQRPLKSKTSLISNCKFESRTFIKDGKLEIQPIKCIAKSHPLFQEFRLWKWLQSLRIYKRGQPDDIEVTGELLASEEDWINLFDFLNDRKEIDQKALIKFFKKSEANYRWNYVEDKSYPCNETRALILLRITKTETVSKDFLTQENEEALWHILYSVEDKIDIEKALKTFAEKKELGNDFVESFKKTPTFKKEYGAYSAKAIKKLLPLMRLGKYWHAEDIHPQAKDRIDKIINAEFDEKIRNRVREKSINLTDITHFQNLPEWLASYIIYDRHSEDEKSDQWKTADKIELLQQHSLRNPIVEQVINETLQVVRDIWKRYGNGEANFFNEIHIELGREMKNPAKKREQMTNQISENENTNLRIKALLAELLNDGETENVRPYSPSQQEILKIYEEGVLSAEDGNIPDEILKISKQSQPTSSELIRYKLWLQQKYRSPYTGSIIPLNKLFTREYDIEHIIPQSRYFDDSFSNKVICETEINTLKDKLLGLEFINKKGGEIVQLSFGRTATIFTLEQYEDFVKNHYSKSRSKMKRLLMNDIPESFIQRQLNDSRYISKVVKNLMSNIVREDDEQESISKNVIVSNGTITSILKQDWGLHDVWNDIITPRFERLNMLTGSLDFGEWTNKEGKRVFQTKMPIELQKGFNKKRIDHRHHALDAIIIACLSRSHVNYLNNESALGKNTKEEKENKRYDLKHKLCFKKYDDSMQNYKWVFYKPWETFTQEARDELANIIISFKQNLRVINKSVNHYQAWKKDESGNNTKEIVKQTIGDNWAIRKPMHKDTVAGLVQLQFKKIVSLSIALDNWECIVNKDLRKYIKELVLQNGDKKQLIKYFKENNNKWNDIDISRIEIFYLDNENVASRVTVDESFGSSKIKNITDTGIQKIMLNHLHKYNEIKNEKIIEYPELAFSPDGLEELNKNIVQLNNGKQHQPIFKVRTYEPKGNKFTIGTKGNKKDKYVEAAKGTNLFFAIYQDEYGKRSYDTIPLNVVIERQKQGLTPVPEVNIENHRLLFYLSPNDLVYLPNEEEKENHALNNNQATMIYKFIDGAGTTANFIPYYSANTIFNIPFKEQEKLKIKYPIQNEYGVGSPQSKNQKSINGIMIKDVCIKLKVDRLGDINPIFKGTL